MFQMANGEECGHETKIPLIFSVLWKAKTNYLELMLLNNFSQF